MIITITGTPCTGKTTLAKEIAKKFKYTYIDVNKIIEENNLEGGYDDDRQCKIIDPKKLNKALEPILKQGNIVIDSHLSHEIPSEKIDLCIVTKCNLKDLEKRLKARGYKAEKIRENMDSEIFDICYVEAKENKHNILILETDKDIPWDDLAKRFK